MYKKKKNIVKAALSWTPSTILTILLKKNIVKAYHMDPHHYFDLFIKKNIVKAYHMDPRHYFEPFYWQKSQIKRSK